MIEFLNSHPILVLIVCTAIIFVFMFATVKVPKKKSEKKDNKVAEKTEKKTETVSDDKKDKVQTKIETEITQDESETKTKLFKKKNLKKAKEKPVISQVFEKTEKKQVLVEPKTKDDEVESDLQKRAEFVNTSKKISKFSGLKNIEDVQGEDISDVSDIDSILQEYDEDCEVCKEIASHFDHSRRLSKFIKEGSFDDMFASHISDHYMNIDSGRHLKLDDIEKRLYDRALKTLSNSEVKVLSDDEDKPSEKLRNDKDYMKSWLEERRREEYAKIIESQEDSHTDECVLDDADDVMISAKNLVIADALLKRKKKISK